MRKYRLDQLLVKRDLADTRSQAENFIKLGVVEVNKKVVTKPGYFVALDAHINLKAFERYVSRAGLKLASANFEFEVDFTGATVLDVGSSTGGFTDYALQNNAKKVIAVDVGSNQLHASLRLDKRIELHEQTDIREFIDRQQEKLRTESIDIVVIDVSFISLRHILPSIARVCNDTTRVFAMLKPQFEAEASTKHKGIIKNERVRRNILKDFEEWVHSYFVVLDKTDSTIHGSKGNIERFYLLKKVG